MQLETAFAEALRPLLPPDLAPRLALAVSGGADSTALALLAYDYCRVRGGSVLALIVDHGLRPESAQEAQLTAQRLQKAGIASRILTLDLAKGAAMQMRAREARYEALAQAACAAGFLYLAVGHHQADQYETVAMRTARGQSGREGMPSWSARDKIMLIRPLLDISPSGFRSFLQGRHMEWVEDPSNQNRHFERVRIRQDQTGLPPQDATQRVVQEQDVARFLAAHAMLYPQGYVLLDAAVMPAAALGALLRTIGGRFYAPKQAAVRMLAAGLRPATLGGVRIARAGRLGAGWLLVREPACCASSVPAIAGARWDGRFVLSSSVETGLNMGALGVQARDFKGYKGLPNLVLQGLPALRQGDGTVVFPAPVCFAPPLPLTQHPFQA